MKAFAPSTVIPGLVPGIHVFAASEDMDARNTCGSYDACIEGRAR